MREHKELKFGTSGLRDTVENMTDRECYINSRGFIAYLQDTGEFKKNQAVALAGDRRPSTYRIKRAVAAAISDMGGVVDDQGQVPSPALAYYAVSNRMPSIMVTGSHIPADRNGIKFTKRCGEVLKSDEAGILENVKKQRSLVRETVTFFDEDGTFKDQAGVRYGKLLQPEEYAGKAAGLYVQRYKDAFGSHFFPGTKIFLYQHSAVGRDIIKEIFEGLGACIIAPDAEPFRSSEFVPVDTESVSEKTLGVFKKVMLDNDLEFGITLDGDSDRPLLVYRDKPGSIRYVTGDILGLLALLGLEDLGIKINAVCVPVSANDSIAHVCREKGIELTETKIGSPFVISAMNDSIAAHPGKWNVFSWESNGGFLTGTDLEIGGRVLKALPTRDAALPLLSALHLIVKFGSAAGILGTLPARFTHADRKKEFPVEKSRAVIDYLTAHDAKEEESVRRRIEEVFLKEDGFGKVERINYTDGIRIYFDNGEISHLRPSGNAPEFRNYAIAGSAERAAEIVRIGLEKIIPELVLKALSSKEKK